MTRRITGRLVKAQFTFVPADSTISTTPPWVPPQNWWPTPRRTSAGPWMVFPPSTCGVAGTRTRSRSREKAAQTVGASAEEIALIHNTTEGMNVVAASMNLEPGDEVILADHEHTSGTIPWMYWQETKGIKLVRPTLPMMPESPGEIVDVYRAGHHPPDQGDLHVPHGEHQRDDPPGAGGCRSWPGPRNILVAVDGAQTAGMFPFDLHEMGCDYYAASSHKWLFSPKGVGIFYARQDAQQHLRPLIVASGYEDESVRRFENYNTRNLPELLGLGVAIDFHNLLGAGAKGERIYDLKHYFREKIAGQPGLHHQDSGPR